MPYLFAKDIARVGAFRRGGQTLTVTEHSLHRLAANFALARARKAPIPIVWNHSRDARDQVGQVLKVRVIAQRLWALFEASDPAAAARIGRDLHHVSPAIWTPWIDGQGRYYDWYLEHVGIVQQPVIDEQADFLRILA